MGPFGQAVQVSAFGPDQEPAAQSVQFAVAAPIATTAPAAAVPPLAPQAPVAALREYTSGTPYDPARHRHVKVVLPTAGAAGVMAAFAKTGSGGIASWRMELALSARE